MVWPVEILFRCPLCSAIDFFKILHPISHEHNNIEKIKKTGSPIDSSLVGLPVLFDACMNL